MRIGAKRRTAALALFGALALAAAGSATGVAQATSAPQADPNAAVAAAMHQVVGTSSASLAAQSRETQVNVMTRAPGWAFGTGLVTAPAREHAAPDARVFVARQSGSGWQVELDGTAGFAALAAAAPVSVVSAAEKQVFADNYRNATAREARGEQAMEETGLSLPWPKNVSWRLTGGLHGWSGQPRPWSSIDLNGGNKRVLAAEAGTAYGPCANGGHVRIIHNNGWTTEYYHLNQEIKPPAGGQAIKLGDYLGLTSTRIPCGGSASGDHVHFALKKGSSFVALQGKTIGGWTFNEGSRAYSGYATRGSTRVNVGGSLLNYGGGPS